MPSKTFDGAIIDLDGTVYLGDQLIDGVRDGLACLRADDIDTLFLTNNPIKESVAYRDRLRSLGIDADLEQIITSSTITADFLATHHSKDSTLVVGEQPLVAELRRADVDVTSDPSSADVVLASMDRTLEYGDLCDVLDAFSEEPVPAFYATNPDRTCPTANGQIPDAAAVIGAIEGMTGRKLDAVLGKPSTNAVEAAAKRLDTRPENCLIAGDRLETDMIMGQQARMTTVLVLSGVSDAADVSSASVEPDHVVDSLGQIDAVLRS